MDTIEPEETNVYRPRRNGHIGNPIAAEANFGLFSIKRDKVNPMLADDYGFDISDLETNHEVHMRWTKKTRDAMMKEFGVDEWEPDLRF